MGIKKMFRETILYKMGRQENLFDLIDFQNISLSSYYNLEVPKLSVKNESYLFFIPRVHFKLSSFYKFHLTILYEWRNQSFV